MNTDNKALADRLESCAKDCELYSPDQFATLIDGIGHIAMRHLLREAAAALTATPSAQAGEGWQPIDTAPKDGSRFIGLTKWGAEVVKWCDGATFDQFGPGEVWIGTEQDSTCLPPNYQREKALCQPTHWRSLEPTTTPQPQGDASPLDKRIAEELTAGQSQCGVSGCTNQATHTWSGHPTCDACGTPGRTKLDVPVVHASRQVSGGGELLPLPKPEEKAFKPATLTGNGHIIYRYTAEQMQAYARACIAALTPRVHEPSPTVDGGAVAVTLGRPDENFGPRFAPDAWARLGRLPEGTPIYTHPAPAPDVARLVELLQHAACPMKEHGCDGTQYPVQPYGEGEQCQWCYERGEALAPFAAAQPKEEG